MNCSLFPLLNFHSKSVHTVSTFKSHVAVIYPKPKVRANIIAHSAKKPQNNRLDFILGELSVPQPVAFQCFQEGLAVCPTRESSSSTTAWPPIAGTKSTNAPPYDLLNTVYNDRYYSCPCQVHSRSLISIFVSRLFLLQKQHLFWKYLISLMKQPVFFPRNTSYRIYELHPSSQRSLHSDSTWCNAAAHTT